MKAKKLPSRIGTFDIETEGLFGNARVIGWMLDGDYFSSESIGDWYEFAIEAESKESHVVWYAHNADFDFGFVATYFDDHHINDDIDWSSSIFTNNTLLRVKLKASGIEVRDSMHLLPGSLDNVLKSWGTQTQKHHIDWQRLGYESLEDYYTRVDVNNNEYREYLKADVRGLYEVLTNLQELTGLDELKLTTASTAIEMFKQHDIDNYELATFPKWSQEKDEYIRQAYYGGRTEVFKPKVTNGYHYDVNSLYPYVMLENEFPIGYPKESTNAREAERLWNDYVQDVYRASIITATVHVSETAGMYPPLPYRQDNKLTFPIGTFTGTWVGAELLYAIEEYNVKIVSFEKVLVWQHTLPIFTSFIAKMMQGKMNSTGAKREFYKLVQNSLYGKFGQSPERKLIGRFTGALAASPDDHNVQFVYKTVYGTLCEFTARRHSPFMQPQIAAFVTAYARVYMLDCMLTERSRGNTVYYMDTDSLVLSKPMYNAYIDDSQYGKFKLESEVTEGIYLLPKLYTEITKEDGHQLIKAKGVPRDIKQGLSIDWFRDVLNLLQMRERTGEQTHIPVYAGYKQRRKFLRSVFENSSLSTPVLTHKTLHFENTKRTMFWDNNSSFPLRV